MSMRQVPLILVLLMRKIWPREVKPSKLNSSKVTQLVGGMKAFWCQGVQLESEFLTLTLWPLKNLLLKNIQPIRLRMLFYNKGTRKYFPSPEELLNFLPQTVRTICNDCVPFSLWSHGILRPKQSLSLANMQGITAGISMLFLMSCFWHLFFLSLYILFQRSLIKSFEG